MSGPWNVSIYIVGSIIFLLVGCLSDENEAVKTLFDDTKGSTAVGGEDGAGPADDVSKDMIGIDLGNEDTSVSVCEAPSEGLGTSLGAKFDASITIKNCDFDNVVLKDLMCGHKLTLIDIGAGWCGPCIDQARILDEEFYEPFKDKGLQVISILFENASGQPANSDFCEFWRDEFKLTSPVLADPTFKTKTYFTDVQSSTPVILLVDENFTIVYKRSGETPSDLKSTIEQQLAK
ncbi:MAG: redoxin domain-containing protein [Myxococcales bacterium]|nr:redoxin domain-containing protein [Myxococcales bacterium]